MLIVGYPKEGNITLSAGEERYLELLLYKVIKFILPIIPYSETSE